MENKSFALVDVAILRVAAEHAKNVISSRIENNRELNQRVYNAHLEIEAAKTPWRKLFEFVFTTEKDPYFEIWGDISNMHDFHFVSEREWHALQLAEKVLTVSDVSNVVYVSFEDVDLLFNWTRGLEDIYNDEDDDVEIEFDR